MGRSPALSAYLLASRLAGPLAPALLRRRMARGKEDAQRVGERLGRAAVDRPDGRLIWLHGASVGEAVSALPLINALQSASDAHILLTTGTVTSAARMATDLPDGATHQFAPVDTAGAVAGFLDHWRPDLAVWIESELWPRLITETAERGIPMAFVNARLSEKSAAGWGRAPAMARQLMGAFGVILAQDNVTVERLAGLGIAAEFAGNLKSLVEAPAADEADLATCQAALGGRPVWLAASTHQGDEAAAFDAQYRLAEDTLLILAPRHPERGDEIEAAANGLPLARRSRGEPPGPETQVWLADTLGEMGLWYRLAPVTFVGGSLSGFSGHTPFEPVALGSAVLHGPDVRNFTPAYATLGAAGGAVEVADGAEMATEVERLLADPTACEAMTTAASDAHERLKPDVSAIAARLLAQMERA